MYALVLHSSESYRAQLGHGVKPKRVLFMLLFRARAVCSDDTSDILLLVLEQKSRRHLHGRTAELLGERPRPFAVDALLRLDGWGGDGE